MEIENDNELDFLDAIRTQSKNLKDIKRKYTSYINAELVTLDVDRKSLLESPHKYILEQLKLTDLDKDDNNKISRILLLMNYLDSDVLQEWYQYFKDSFESKEIPKPPEKPEEITPESVSEYNNKANEYRTKILPVLEEYNTKYKSIMDTFSDLIEDNLFGDETLDVTDMRYVYFKFYNLDETYIKSFVKDIKNTGAEKLKLIKRIVIEDVIDSVPDGIDYAFEVRYYFEDGNDSELMKSSKVLFESFYEKYMQMSFLMKQGSADWGLDIMKKSNSDTFNNSQSFQGTSNMNTGNGLDEDTDDDEKFNVEDIEDYEIEDKGFKTLKNDYYYQIIFTDEDGNNSDFKAIHYDELSKTFTDNLPMVTVFISNDPTYLNDDPDIYEQNLLDNLDTIGLSEMMECAYEQTQYMKYKYEDIEYWLLQMGLEKGCIF